MSQYRLKSLQLTVYLVLAAIIVTTLVTSAMLRRLERHSDIPPEPTTRLTHFLRIYEQTMEPYTVVALGDSNTEVNWTSEGQLNWTGHLSAGMAQHRVLVNAGQGGDTAAGGLARLGSDVLSAEPDLVIVTFGTNDLALDTLENFEASMRGIVDGIRAAGPASILLRTPNPNYDMEAGTWLESEKLDQIAEIIREIAAEKKTGLVDHYALWRDDENADPAELMLDPVHPNAQGHRRFYAELAPVFGLPKTHFWERETE